MLQPLISFFQLHKILQLNVVCMTSWYLYSTYVYNKVFKVMQGKFTLNFPLCLLSVPVPLLYNGTPKIYYYNIHTKRSQCIRPHS